MRTPRLSRRQAIERGALAGVTAVVGLSGCLGFFSEGEDGDAYRRWLPAPRTQGFDSYTFNFVRPRSWLEGDGAIHEEMERFFATIESTYADTGVAAGEMETFLYFTNQVVITGSFEGDAVRDRLGERGYTHRGTYEDYDVYAADDGNGDAVGIDGSTLVWANHGPASGLVGDVETTIDAERGDTPRYDAENEAFGAMVDALGGGDLVTGQTHAPEQPTARERGLSAAVVASGTALTIDGETVAVRLPVVLESEAAMDGADVDAWANDAGRFDFLADRAVERDGRVATVTGRLPTADVDASFL